MDWQNFRIQKRLNLTAKVIEKIYATIAQVDGMKNSWQITDKLLPQTIKRLTHSVIITSSGSSNRIRGNSLTDKQVEGVYKNLKIKNLKPEMSRK